MKTITPVAVLASLALAVPAAAHDQHGPDHSTRPPKTHTCEAPKPRAVAYRVAGTLVSGAAPSSRVDSLTAAPMFAGSGGSDPVIDSVADAAARPCPRP
jgi:hypothetical protein